MTAKFDFQFPDHLSDLVLLDCDEVLLNWTGAFGCWVRRDLGIALNGDEPLDFGMKLWFPEAHRERIWDYVMTFNTDPGLGFRTLEPLPGAVEAVRALRESGHRIRVITACSTEAPIMASRLDNLAAVFGPDAFEDVDFVRMSDSKAEKLSRHPPSVWIDDRPGHVIAGVEAGHYGIVMEQATNRHERTDTAYAALPWIEGWSTFLPHIGALPRALRADAGLPVPG
ncbi:5' nucleotidase, NT5C type [Defluviimonas salinarum]|uniref:HAD family hydrolase n=1 Tax=Defluviimonas salinarum TaxID=2992147 RepID=A0ABT3J7G4_9RHOB|nr:hypothetical protein [Defluviimonas salinarum]MCW3783585.1 hypothetical protein [Defluviimonas salinarum]